MDKLGRKLSALFATIPTLLGWLVLIFSKNVWMLYISRFILGYAASFYGVVGPVLVGEIAEPKIRGVLSNMYGIFLTSGMLCSYVVGSFVDWQMLSIISAIIPVVQFFMLIFTSESPRHLLHRGKYEKAAECLAWYRGVTRLEDVETEIKAIPAANVSKSDGNLSLRKLSIFQRNNAMPLVLCVALVFIEQLSGFAVIVSYTADIFKSAGHTANGNTLAIIFGGFQLLARALSCLLIDKAGRRPLLLMGEVGMTVSLGILGTYFYFFEKLNTVLISSWVPVICLVVYICMFSVGIGPISTTVMGEILPQEIRGVGSALCTAALRGSAFTITFAFEGVKDQVGSYGVFWIFAGVCAIGLITIYFWIPETKGKSFEDIKSLFLDV
ncbi:Facilitated trehalose transporter Tret1-2 [Folsomia candida]|uniref:Facilitated trehalose transporter Tret1-2 n=2 Tax=Folsomia candida TaxID=158441 RepID=A0A226DUC3_FOLCA|nr:Facilitated trehalose transporter Tret1-2 [Folsomia candida]